MPIVVVSVVMTLVVITLIGHNYSPLAERREQRNQLSQLRLAEMAELFPVNLVNPARRSRRRVTSGTCRTTRSAISLRQRPVGSDPPQNPKNVVLRCRNPMRLQGGLKGVPQQRRRALDAEVRLLFKTLEGPCLFQFYLQLRAHLQILRVITRIVNVEANFRRRRVRFRNQHAQIRTRRISVV
jgi:hypothetical protein